MNSLFASTVRELGELLKTELKNLDALECQVVQGGVRFRGSTQLVYQGLVWSRLASCIILPIGEYKIYSDLDLCLGVQTVNWTEVFNPGATFAVRFNKLNGTIRNGQYGMLKVEDTIIDAFTRRNMPHPNMDRGSPDLRISIWLNKDTANVAPDPSDDGLHQCGYRDHAGQAPTKETLAAIIAMRSDWQPGTPLLDPMCGSDMLLIEAAMWATSRVPGLYCGYWGFSGQAQHNEAVWQEAKAEAQMRARKGLADHTSHSYGSDSNAYVIGKACSNTRRTGIAGLMTFGVKGVVKLSNPLPKRPYRTVINNPPYDRRLDGEPALVALRSLLGRTMKNQSGGWNLSLFSTSPDLLGSLQLRAGEQFKTKDGPLDCVQKNYHVAETIADSEPATIAEDYVNRLHKNIRKLEKWTRQEDIKCCRLYDTDLPEYSVAVDCYSDWVMVQEYAPPKAVDTQKACRHLLDIVAITLPVLKIASNKLILKTREHQKGKNQYQKMNEKGEFIEVSKYNARLRVNLTNYLDTGLSLDCRITCRMLGQVSKDKDFLNLFSYIGSTNVHAGLGGARSTTTVDMSRTCLEWAERNLRLNGLSGRVHRLTQTDYLGWLRDANEQFDLTFIDPPTFSNSKRMEDSFDMQRNHLTLMKDPKRLLRKDGTIMFSNNKRGFRMNLDGLVELRLKA